MTSNRVVGLKKGIVEKLYVQAPLIAKACSPFSVQRCSWWLKLGQKLWFKTWNQILEALNVITKICTSNLNKKGSPWRKTQMKPRWGWCPLSKDYRDLQVNMCTHWAHFMLFLFVVIYKIQSVKSDLKK